MSKGCVVVFKKPGEIFEDPLPELVWTGAQQMIAQAAEAELHVFFMQFAAVTDKQGRQQVVRDGHLPERRP